ncbi:MAG TPA: tetratricopeptide repeat protein, partial [Polyangia bacterium]
APPVAVHAPPAEVRGPAPPTAPIAAPARADAPAVTPPPAHAAPAAPDANARRRALALRRAKMLTADDSDDPAKPVAAPAPEPAPPTPARGLREVLAEAEKLLAQGEVGDACARGEEANKLAPKSPQVHKFLGKCYMRAGRTREANDNYKQYLELAPNAADAPFVKSMIR